MGGGVVDVGEVGVAIGGGVEVGEVGVERNAVGGAVIAFGRAVTNLNYNINKWIKILK